MEPETKIGYDQKTAEDLHRAMQLLSARAFPVQHMFPILWLYLSTLKDAGVALQLGTTGTLQRLYMESAGLSAADALIAARALPASHTGIVDLVLRVLNQNAQLLSALQVAHQRFVESDGSAWDPHENDIKVALSVLLR